MENINKNVEQSFGRLTTNRLEILEKGKDPAVIIFNGTLCPIHAGNSITYKRGDNT